MSPAVRPAGAQETYRRVTLAEAVALFAEHNLELRIARADAAEMKGLALQAAAYPNPTVSTSYEPLFGQGNHQSETYVNFNQRFERPGVRRARIAAAEAIADAAFARTRSDSLQLAFEVVRTYIEAAAAEKRVADLVTVTEVFRSADNTGINRVAEGDLSGYDLRRLRVERARYENALALAGLEATETRRRLAALVMPDETELGVAESLPANPPVFAFDTAMELARRRRADLAEARAELSAAEADIRLAARERLPDITATAGIKHQSDGLNGFFLGASVPLPVFDHNRGTLNARKARLEAARTRLELAERQVEMDVRRTFATYTSIHDRVQLIGRDLLAGAEELLQIAHVSYEEGEMSLVELLDAADAYRDARLTTADLLTAYWISYFDLLRASGGSSTVSF